MEYEWRKPTWLTNGRVAWYIGNTRLAMMYVESYYIAPEGWKVIQRKQGDDWKLGVCGEMRIGSISQEIEEEDSGISKGQQDTDTGKGKSPAPAEILD